MTADANAEVAAAKPGNQCPSCAERPSSRWISPVYAPKDGTLIIVLTDCSICYLVFWGEDGSRVGWCDALGRVRVHPRRVRGWVYAPNTPGVRRLAGEDTST